MSYNKVILIGRLTKEPELKTTQSGVAVLSGTVAVDRAYKQGDERKTDFINFVAWRKTAEFIGQWFRKGSAILLDGELQVRDYVAQDGTKRYVTEVIVGSAAFVESRNAQGAQGTPTQVVYNAPPAQVPTQASAPMPTEANWTSVGDEDDLPF